MAVALIALVFVAIALFTCPRLAGQEAAGATFSLVNVALVSRGAEIDASSYLGQDVPDHLIDGSMVNSITHRWHSDISKPFPQWLQFKFPRPLPLRQIIFHASSVSCFPTKISVERQGSDGTLTGILDTTLVPGPMATVSLPALTTDNLRITILASNSNLPGYVQLSAVEVLAAISPQEAEKLASLGGSDNNSGPVGEKNVALASAGSAADVSSVGIFGRNHADYGKQDVLASAAQLIDGRHVVFGGPSPKTPDAPDPSAPWGNRWICQVDEPNPHWAWIRFNGAKRIDCVILRCSSLTNFPTDFQGQYSKDGGKTFLSLFTVRDQRPNRSTQAMKCNFPAVTTDNFRLLITRSVASSPAEDNTQLSEIEVYGQDDGPPPVEAVTTPAVMPGFLLSPQEGDHVTINDRPDEVELRSGWQRVVFSKTQPRITNICWDSMGKGEFGIDLLTKTEGIGPRVDRPTYDPLVPQATLARQGNVVRYGPFVIAQGLSMTWEIRVTEKKVEMAVATHADQSVVIRPGLVRLAFDDGQTLTSPFYTPKHLGYATFPVIMNAADFGTAMFQSKDMIGFHVRPAEYASGQTFFYCDLTPVLPTRTDGLVDWPSGDWQGKMTWEVNQITPLSDLAREDSRVTNLPRFALNGLQYRPDQDMLCNSEVSINCPFCLWEYSEVAQWLPVLPGGINTCDMLRISIDKYIHGVAGYGPADSIYSADWNAPSDTVASFVYAMWTYVLKTGDKDQLRRWLPALDRIIALIETGDTKHDGLLYTGPTIHAAGWFDTGSIQGLDTASNMFGYRAFQDAADLYRMAGEEAKAAQCDERAAGIKKAFVPKLLDPKTGIIAGGILQDGTMIDPWYVWINGMAITYGLVSPELANQILDKFQAKFKAVGYTLYKNGLPNCLESIPCPPQLVNPNGGPFNQFQVYLNGGATPAWSNFYIQALYQMGRRDEADALFFPLVQSYAEGRFNGGGSNRRDGLQAGSIENDRCEWRSWNGTPSHAEGYLTDMYHPFTVLWTGRYGLKFGAQGYTIAPWSSLKGKPAPLGLEFNGETIHEAK